VTQVSQFRFRKKARRLLKISFHVVNTELSKLLQGNPALWRGRESNGTSPGGIKTGFPELDAALPARGWPANALMEIVTQQWGMGELRLLLPAMAELGRQRRWIIWIAPPYIPYAPALVKHGINLKHTLVLLPEDTHQDVLWSMEKTLRTQVCGMALAWPERLTDRTVRRLQLAAEAGSSLGILFRTVDRASPAALRLRLKAHYEGLQVDILKARGGNRCGAMHLRL
jgi:hypothetical protein